MKNTKYKIILLSTIILTSCVQKLPQSINSNQTANINSELNPKPFPLPENANYNRKLIYITNSSAKELYSINSDGSNKEELSDLNLFSSTLSALAISNDGSKVFYSDSNGVLTQINIDGSNKKVIFNNPDFIISEINLSSDGKKLLFSKTQMIPTFPSRKISIYNIDSGELKEFDDAIGVNPTFSPDGSKIAFTENVNSKTQIYIMNSDGSNLKKISDSKYRYINPQWSADSSKIYSVFTDGDNQTLFLGNENKTFSFLAGNKTNLASISLDDFSIKTIIKDCRSNFVISPDGTKIAYINDLSQAFVTIADINGKKLKESPYIEIKKIQWSPDNSKIAILVKNNITVMNIDNLTSKQITNEFVRDPDPQSISSESGVLNIAW